MSDLSPNINISFQEIINELVHGETPLNQRLLHRLSDLIEEETSLLKEVWSDIIEWRKQALLEDLETLYARDTLLSFESICKIALEDQNPQIRFLALRSLQEYEVVDLIPTFIEIMILDEDEELRALAAANLGKYVYLGEVEAISKQKKDNIENNLLNVAQGSDSSIVRRKAIESLGYSSHKKVPQLIKDAYNSQQAEWVASALFAMGRTIDPRWRTEIIKMLNSPIHEVRFEAIKAAGELELSESRRILIEYLDDQNQEIRMASVWALANIGGENTQAILEDVLQRIDLEEEEISIIEEALDHLIFNQSLGTIEDLDYYDPDEFGEFSM